MLNGSEFSYWNRPAVDGVTGAVKSLRSERHMHIRCRTQSSIKISPAAAAVASRGPNASAAGDQWGARALSLDANPPTNNPRRKPLSSKRSSIIPLTLIFSSALTPRALPQQAISTLLDSPLCSPGPSFSPKVGSNENATATSSDKVSLRKIYIVYLACIITAESISFLLSSGSWSSAGDDGKI